MPKPKTNGLGGFLKHQVVYELAVLSFCHVTIEGKISQLHVLLMVGDILANFTK